MNRTINEHGETVTVIGSVTDGRGGRQEISIVEFRSCGLPCFSLHGRRGHPGARRFSTQLRRAKTYYAHPSNAAEWYL